MKHDENRSKLTRAEVEDIRKAYREGVSLRVIALHYPKLGGGDPEKAWAIVHAIVQQRPWPGPEEKKPE
jgi:uncharacterized protein (DUF433 family)